MVFNILDGVMKVVFRVHGELIHDVFCVYLMWCNTARVLSYFLV